MCIGIAIVSGRNLLRILKVRLVLLVWLDGGLTVGLISDSDIIVL